MFEIKKQLCLGNHATIASLSFSKTEAPFSKCFSFSLKRKASGLKSVFENFPFLSSRWISVEIWPNRRNNAAFSIFPALCGQKTNSTCEDKWRDWFAFIHKYFIIRFHDLMTIIIHQTHYEKSDWSRAFNQFTIACELDMINAISAADIAFIMSSSTSAWLLSPLKCSPQKQNGWTLRFCFWGWIMWKMYNKTIIEFGFRMISWIIKTSCLCYLLRLRLRQITQTSVLIIHDIMLNLIQ